MTRGQQKKLRELKQSVTKIIQKEIRKYKFKKKDYMVWYSDDTTFFSLLLAVTEIEGHCYCISRESIKPLWFDDLLWDILDIPENKNEPLSLRSIGAFTVHGVITFEEEKELITWESEELEEYLSDYIAHFNTTIQSITLGDFYNFINQPAYHVEVRELLILIHRKQYDEALEYIKTMENDSFSNAGVGFRERAEIYCKKHQ